VIGGCRRVSCWLCVTSALIALGGAAPAAALAQPSVLTQRGFVEVRGLVYAEDAPNDDTRAIVDLLGREELEWRPRNWLRLAGTADVRADTNGQVARNADISFSDRTAQRPALAIRRVDVTARSRGVSLDAGKQFIRWGRADLLNPTDRFAPRDFLEVTDNEFLAVSGIRALYERGPHTLDVVWVPRMTPSRTPLFDRRWTVVPAQGQPLRIADGGAIYPSRTQAGARYSFTGSRAEFAVAAYDGVNHLPSIDAVATSALSVLVVRRYPPLRMAGGDAAVPLRWMTLKGEAAYIRAGNARSDNYVQYVVQAERQIGEWSLVGGYAGERVTRNRRAQAFAPDRGLARTLLGRASYTIDVNRSVAIEGAVRQNGDGVYVRGEFSRAAGQHWRTTARVTWIDGATDDFLGQYRRNSHASLTLRYSF
jgi:hypothetical protein